ncbi:HalOD1 output domain-containing protein [Halorussus halobius]|uniref:HalOD1 output domain-containing protein n=1 Tax=Halorussus halobius TaxID=1710537 RepID=UPI001092CC80|nr:HalOD1 output domain-containing protein [Halorussus halobius]
MTHDTEELTERAPSLDRDDRAAHRVEPNDWNPSTAVVLAVTEVTDADPLDDGPVLYDVLDPDALDRLFDDRHDGTERPVGRVSFELRGCRVEVRSDSEVIVFEPTEASGDSRSPAARSA